MSPLAATAHPTRSSRSSKRCDYADLNRPISNAHKVIPTHIGTTRTSA
jgi:hypothetical protein